MRASESWNDWKFAAAIVGWFALAVCAISGCGATMTDYYRGVATASDAARTCYRVLDDVDASKAKAVRDMVKVDREGARLLNTQWIETYSKARTACNAIDALASEALAAAPTVEHAASRDKEVSGWLVRLAQLAMDTVAVLRDLGIDLPLGGK